ncbi:MAG TPA: WD40 repeat domain-containing protein [Candidatus Babeliales bacterium]|nr:WD40 repeat domain-containing protein [Candidatus Babeliales bacterium]
MNTKNIALFIFLMLTNVVLVHAMRLPAQEQAVELQKYNYPKTPALIDINLPCDKLFGTSEEQRAEQGASKELELKLQQEVQHKNQYFLYATNDPIDGIWVDKKFLKKNCEALKNMIADFGKTQEVEISIGLFPLAVIKLGFDILTDISRVPYLLFSELINVANIFNFLDAPANKMQPVLDRLLVNFNDIPDQELKQLNSDVQKLLMTDSTVNYLKDCIIKKYAQERKQVLEGHSEIVNAVAFSPDGKYIVAGGFDDQNNLILWDVSNPNHITHQALEGHQDNVTSVAFSPDGKYIVSGSYGNQNNLIVWDVSNTNNITHQVLVGHQGTVTAVAFNPDGKYIVSGSWGNQPNLIVWDVSNQNNIIHQVLEGYPKDANAVAFSPDGKHIVSGSNDGQNNLIVWDMSNLNNITHQVLVGHSDRVFSVAFSPDGKHIVSGHSGNQHNLIVWTLLTDQEEALLKQLTDYSADQMRLIYRLCCNTLSGKKITQNSEEQILLKSLSQDMQRLLTDLF